MTAHDFTVYDMIARGAAVHGDAPAVIQGDRADLVPRARAARGRARRRARRPRPRHRATAICILAQNDAGLSRPLRRVRAPGHHRVPDQLAPHRRGGGARARARGARDDGGRRHHARRDVAGWPARKPAVPHWYQLGDGAGAGLASVRRAVPAPGRRRLADVSADDPFAVISTAAVDVIPRGAVLTHANVLAANLTVMSCLGVHRRADRYLARAAALPHHRARQRPGAHARGRRERTGRAVRRGRGGAR